MPRVFFAIPSAAPIPQAKQCIEAWRDQGFAIALLHEDAERLNLRAEFRIMNANYRGYAVSVNRLAKLVIAHDPECEIVVSAGDDVWPCETKRADEIADEFLEHFGGTLGVLQPHGDDAHHRQKDGSYALDTAAWSPWLGRDWCRRAFMGRGPMHPGFYHYFSSTNLQQVAEWLGLFWQRADIIQRDDNWKRSDRRHLGRPPYLVKAKAHAPADRALFHRLKAEGFPSCGLLPEV